MQFMQKYHHVSVARIVEGGRGGGTLGWRMRQGVVSLRRCFLFFITTKPMRMEMSAIIPAQGHSSPCDSLLQASQKTAATARSRNEKSTWRTSRYFTPQSGVILAISHSLYSINRLAGPRPGLGLRDYSVQTAPPLSQAKHQRNYYKFTLRFRIRLLRRTIHPNKYYRDI